jgi:hypothetical protein
MSHFFPFETTEFLIPLRKNLISSEEQLTSLTYRSDTRNIFHSSSSWSSSRLKTAPRTVAERTAVWTTSARLDELRFRLFLCCVMMQGVKNGCVGFTVVDTLEVWSQLLYSYSYTVYVILPVCLWVKHLRIIRKYEHVFAQGKLTICKPSLKWAFRNVTIHYRVWVRVLTGP